MMNADHISIATSQLGATEWDRTVAVLKGGMITGGPEARGFKREFADYCGTGHGVATSNGTTVLHATLHTLGVGPGDHVLIMPLTFITMANTAVFTGAEVGFVDIDSRTHNIDPDALETRLRAGERVGAVTAIHFYGLPMDMTRLTELAAEYDFLLVGDATQTHGAAVKERHIGSFGDAACFSLYPTKNMTTNEGGMITTNRADAAERVVRLMDHGHASDYEHAEVGHNFCITSIVAAIGRIQLECLPELTRAGQANAAVLTEYLEDSPITTPHTPPDRTHVFHQYTVARDGTEHDALESYLDAKDIAASIYYPKPVHKQFAYEHLAVPAPIVKEAAIWALSLSVHPGLSEADMGRVGTTVANYAEVAR